MENVVESWLALQPGEQDIDLASVSLNRGNRWKFKKCAFEESPLHPEFDETILISFFDYFYIFEDHYRTLSKQTILQS